MDALLRCFDSSTERRLWAVWIAATWVAGLALANAALSGDLLVAAACGVLPGLLLAQAGQGSFGSHAQSQLHQLVLKRRSFPLLIVALLAPSIALGWIFGPAAWIVLVGTMTVFINTVINVVIFVVGLVIVVVVAAAMFGGMANGSASSTPTIPVRKPLDLTASFRHELPRKH